MGVYVENRSDHVIQFGIHGGAVGRASTCRSGPLRGSPWWTEPVPALRVTMMGTSRHVPRPPFGFVALQVVGQRRARHALAAVGEAAAVAGLWVDRISVYEHYALRQWKTATRNTVSPCL